MNNIQAVLLNKNYFTLNEAMGYLISHGYYPIKPIHETKNYYRARLKQPNKNHKYFTKKIREGVKYILQY